MPYKEKEIEKKYFSIGEVAKIVGVTPSMIRFWEKAIHRPSPRKSRKGVRRYVKQDIEQLQSIYRLVKEQGFTLKGANRVLKHQRSSVGKQASNPQELIQSLKELRNILVELETRSN